MWKSTVGVKPVAASAVLGRNDDDDDDWETGKGTTPFFAAIHRRNSIQHCSDTVADPDYVNNMSEEQQRWGGARDTGTIDMDAFRRDVQQEDAAEQKKKARNVCAHTFKKDSPKDTGR